MTPAHHAPAGGPHERPIAGSLRPLLVRRILGRDVWGIPRPYGPDGMILHRADGKRSVLVSVAPDSEGVEWIHASIAGRDELPTYDELTQLHRAVWPSGFAYQCFVPPASHVNIHPYALHLWGRLDGLNPIPDFGKEATI